MPTSAFPLRYIQHPPLSACASLAHAFLLRATEVDTAVASKSEAIERLTPHFRAHVEHLGFDWADLQTAEQTHGTELAVVDEPRGGLNVIPIVDGLLTDRPGVLLGIMVADCCAVSVVDPDRKAIALVHSGKAGTEAGIVSRAIAGMREAFSSEASNLIVHLSPCIRPPHYEIDFAATIREQAAHAGVPGSQIHDAGTCTASDPTTFYSYRREQGKTGRMLALLGYPLPA